MSKRNGDYVEMTDAERAELRELEEVKIPAAQTRAQALSGRMGDDFAEADAELGRLVRRRNELLNGTE